MDRMAAAMGAFTCIQSDPVEPVDPEKPWSGQLSAHLHLHQPAHLSLIDIKDVRTKIF